MGQNQGRGPPGMSPPGPNGMPMHPGLMDPSLSAGHPPLPPGFMMGPRGPMPIPGTQMSICMSIFSKTLPVF